MLYSFFIGLFSKLRVIFKNPLVVFIYGIMAKWYVIFMVTCLVVTFYVFKGLTNAGILQHIERVTFQAFTDAKSVAKYCIPEIGNWQNFWGCLKDTPDYEETEEEKQLKKGFEDLLNIDDTTQDDDPYAK